MKTAMMLSAALTAVLASGCVSKRSGGASFRDAEWTEGATTAQDVVAAWGNPDAIQGPVWIWCENRHLGGKVKAAYYGIGFTVSRVNVAVYEHRFEFGETGRLVRFETSRSVSGGERWSINPL